MIEHPAGRDIAIGANALMQPNPRRQVGAVLVLLAQATRGVAIGVCRHRRDVGARILFRQRISLSCSRRFLDIVLASAAPFAPVVKRTSRRSPEPQVRVRFPAGALNSAYRIKVILRGMRVECSDPPPALPVLCPCYPRIAVTFFARCFSVVRCSASFSTPRLSVASSMIA